MRYPGMLHRWLLDLEQRALAGFTEWFCSRGGVYQTLFLVIVFVVVEAVDRSLDPNAFTLMAVLTIYSAVTQPALAFANAEGAVRSDRNYLALQDHYASLQARFDDLERELHQISDLLRERGASKDRYEQW